MHNKKMYTGVTARAIRRLSQLLFFALIGEMKKNHERNKSLM